MESIHILIFIFVLIAIISYKKYIDYENYINEPYLTVRAKSGLCNKIRVIISYLYKANIEGKKLRVIWQVDQECPDTYNNLFEPIENMEVVNVETDQFDYDTWDEDNVEYIDKKYLNLLLPINSIQNIIYDYKQKLQNNYIACHIRRTDALSHGGHHPISDQEYMNFIDKYPSNMKIYIATDNRDTQDIFINKYQDRIISKKIIPSNEYRQTSLQDAVADIYVCIGAKYFLGSNGSSFSGLINRLRI